MTTKQTPKPNRAITIKSFTDFLTWREVENMARRIAAKEAGYAPIEIGDGIEDFMEFFHNLVEPTLEEENGHK